MLKKEDFAVIQALAKRGVYLKDIATELGVHPKTVRRALQRGSAPPPQRTPRGSKLAPFHAQVDQLLAAGVWNSVVILRALQAAGYTGRDTILREYIAPKRARRAGRATVRFETPPGQQLQTAWGELVTLLAGQPSKVYFIVNQLGYSRRFHAWGAPSLDAEHTYEGLIRSFEYFAGVPQQVLVDNQQAAVLRHQGETVQFNPRFVDLAAHYGFAPQACRPYRARTKGKDERMVGYVKHHFFVRYRTFESWAHLNQLLEQWLRSEADQRLHSTVHEVVASRFAREAPHLQPLPAQRYDTAYREHRQVSWDSYVAVRGNRYSVPASLVGQVVAIHLSLDGHLRVVAGDQVVATHQLQGAAQGWVTVAEHHAALWEQVTGPVEQRPLAVYEEVAQWN